MAVAKIYEFSTGITYKTRNGQWVSTGFTVGEYMNQTIEKIPQSVERAIANNLFEVLRSSENPEPTIVGRVVSGKEQGALDWSVVAIATTGIDDDRGHTGFYRYFLCRGADSLWKIVDWMEDYRKTYDNWPIYNPADTKNIGQQTLHDCDRPTKELSSQVHDLLNQKPTSLIFEPEQNYDLTTINAMAEYKAQTKSQPISWAWNVEGLEYPTSFLVIQVANDTAYKLLDGTPQSQASEPIRSLNPGISMTAIESSIKGLIGGGNIKQEWIKTVVQTKKQNQLTREEWEKIFEDLGANSGSVSANIVRLLTVRAIILPEKLPEYLQYLDIKRPKQTLNQQQQTSLQFQAQIRAYRSFIDSLLSEGAISVAELMSDRKKLDFLPGVAWLFDGTQPGLWLKYKTTFVSTVQENFKQLSSSRKEYASLEKLFKSWGDQLYISSDPSSPKGGTGSKGSASSQTPEKIPSIKPLRKNMLEVVFQGVFLVIFFISVAFQQPKHAHVLIYAIAAGLIRFFWNQERLDESWKFLALWFTIIITFLALVVNHLGDPNKEEPVPKLVVPVTPTPNRPATPVPNPTSGSVIKTDREQQTAIALIDETKTAIYNIVDELAQELLPLEGLNDREQRQDQEARKSIVITALRETLNHPFDLQYGSVIEGEVGNDRTHPASRDKWIEAISSDRQTVPDFKGKGYGYMEQEKQTDRALRKEIGKNPLFIFGSRTSVALNQDSGQFLEERLNPSFYRWRLREDWRLKRWRFYPFHAKNVRSIVNDIVDELKDPSGNSPTETEIVNPIQTALNVKDLDDIAAKNGNLQEIKHLIKAITKYPQTNGLTPDRMPDRIIETGRTKDEVKQLLADSGQA